MSDKIKQIYGYTAGKIDELSKASAKNKAELAVLRRGAGKKLADSPELWAVVLGGMPEGLLGSGGKASAAEESIYTALTLYALAQQGKEKNMNVPGRSVGKALGMLVRKDSDLMDRMMGRLKKLVASKNHEAVDHNLRSIIQLLKEKEIGLDFSKLAVSLYTYHYPDGQQRVRNEWAHDFYRAQYEDSEDDAAENSKQEEN